MRVFKKQFVLLIIFALILGFIPRVKADGSLSASETKIKAGGTVSFTVSAGSGVELTGSIKDEKHGISMGINKASSDTNTNVDLNNKVNYTFNSPGTYTLILKNASITNANEDTTDLNGSVTVVVEPTDNTPPPSTGDDSLGSSSSGTTAEEGSAPTEKPKEESEENKSNNNSLASITLSEGSLSPAFYRDTLDYSVEFPDDFNLRALKSIHVDAKAEDEKATVEGTGEITLDEGENVIKITCTAENGTPKTYSLKIVKPLALKVSDLRLTKLELSSINTKGDSKPLDLKLENDKFEYSVEVGEDITEVTTTAEAESGIKVSVKGGKNLSNGSNLIEITLTSEADETVQTSYVVKVNKKAKTAATTGVNEEKINKRNKIITWILFGFIIALIILLLLLLMLL